MLFVLFFLIVGSILGFKLGHNFVSDITSYREMEWFDYGFVAMATIGGLFLGLILGIILALIFGGILPQKSRQTRNKIVNIYRSVDVRTSINAGPVIGIGGGVAVIPETNHVPIVVIKYSDNGVEKSITTDESTVSLVFDVKEGEEYFVHRTWHFPSAWMDLFGFSADTEYIVHLAPGIHI